MCYTRNKRAFAKIQLIFICTEPEALGNVLASITEETIEEADLKGFSFFKIALTKPKLVRNQILWVFLVFVPTTTVGNQSEFYGRGSLSLN